MSSDAPVYPFFIPGQRWLSDPEPELGLGLVAKTDSTTVFLSFPSCAETRRYSLENSPLRRVRFEPGAKLRDHSGTEFTVEKICERNGLLTYRGEGFEVPESQLHDSLSLNAPFDRLLAARVDSVRNFELRQEALARRHWWRNLSVRGFLGGKISLIPHQLYVAHASSERQRPRVLLADEVGLGKTIEACLILHRLLVCERIQRVLILVPPALVHQWLVELLRRFNLWFNIFDEQRCEAIEAGQQNGNPFHENQLILCSLGWMAALPNRARQATEAGWDMLIVDEAHHLEWTPGNISKEYNLVETLAKNTEGILLLTATPEQLGQSGHFARLRLLDPNRFHSLEAFRRESSKYHEIARLCQNLVNKKSLTNEERLQLVLLGCHELKTRPISDYDPQQLARDLVDRLREKSVTAMHLYPFAAIVEQLEVITRGGDLLVTMGAGDVWRVAQGYLEKKEVSGE